MRAKQRGSPPLLLPIHNTNHYETMNTRMRKFTAWLSLVAAGAFLPSIYGQPAPQPAQPSPTNTSPTGTTILEKFEVTGSYLPAAANAIAIPVISLDAGAIQRSGEAMNV